MERSFYAVSIAVFWAMVGCGGEEKSRDGMQDGEFQDWHEVDIEFESEQDLIEREVLEPSELDGPEVVDGEEEEQVHIEPSAIIAFTTNSAYDYSSGSYSVFNITDGSVSPDTGEIHSDSVVRCRDNNPFVIERMGADSIIYLSISSPYSIEWQVSVEAGSNPLDLALVDPQTAIVTRNNVNSPAILNLTDRTVDTDSIDLSEFADADGIVEMAGVIFTGGKIFISLQLLDRETPFWDPTDKGRVVVLDNDFNLVDIEPSTPQMDVITLTGANPLPKFQIAPTGDGVFVGEVGYYGRLDGGIESFDVSSFEVTGFIVTEESLGGDVSDWVVVDETVAYATVSKVDFSGDMLVRFNPLDGTVEPEPLLETSSGFTLRAVDVTVDGKILVADRSLDASGLWVIDAETGEKIVAEPVSVGLAPFSVCSVVIY